MPTLLSFPLPHFVCLGFDFVPPCNGKEIVILIQMPQPPANSDEVLKLEGRSYKAVLCIDSIYYKAVASPRAERSSKLGVQNW